MELPESRVVGAVGVCSSHGEEAVVQESSWIEGVQGRGQETTYGSYSEGYGQDYQGAIG